MARNNRAWSRAAAAGTRWGGHPPAGRREHRVRFWEAIARGASSEKAAVEAGVLPSIGVRWFRKGGGMPPLTLAPVSGRYLSFAEREEIAVLLAGGCGVRRSRVSSVVRRRRSPGSCNATRRSDAAELNIEPRPPTGMRSVAPGDPSRQSSRSTRSCGRMCRTGFRGRCSGLTGASRVQISHGVGGVRDRARIVAGGSAGARSRSLVASAWTSPMMNRCACLTRRSISRSISRAAERCAAN